MGASILTMEYNQLFFFLSVVARSDGVLESVSFVVHWRAAGHGTRTAHRRIGASVGHCVRPSPFPNCYATLVFLPRPHSWTRRANQRSMWRRWTRARAVVGCSGPVRSWRFSSACSRPAGARLCKSEETRPARSASRSATSASGSKTNARDGRREEPRTACRRRPSRPTSRGERARTSSVPVSCSCSRRPTTTTSPTTC
jgi:hypothetical protein